MPEVVEKITRTVEVPSAVGGVPLVLELATADPLTVVVAGVGPFDWDEVRAGLDLVRTHAEEGS